MLFSRLLAPSIHLFRAEKILITLTRALSILLAAAMSAAILITPAGAAELKKTAPDLDKERIEKLIESYILRHPEVILKSVKDHQARQKAAQAAQAKKNLKIFSKQLTRNPGSPVGGNPKGDVTVVEFFDYHCSYCRKSFPALMEIEKTDPKGRIVFKEFPILGPGSVFAARVALAAKAQGKYLEIHKAMMSGKAKTDEAGLMSLAKSLGMDLIKLRQDMNSPDIRKELINNQELGQVLGITGTPAFIIGDELITGGMNTQGLRELIQRARKGHPGLRLQGG